MTDTKTKTRSKPDTAKQENAPVKQQPTTVDPAVLQRLAVLEAAKDDADNRLAALETRVGALRVTIPRRALTEHEVSDVIAANPRAEFTLIEDYRHAGHHLRAGRDMSAAHYPRLLDHVRNGMKLAVAD